MPSNKVYPELPSSAKVHPAPLTPAPVTKPNKSTSTVAALGVRAFNTIFSPPKSQTAIAPLPETPPNASVATQSIPTPNESKQGGRKSRKRRISRKRRVSRKFKKTRRPKRRKQ